MGLRNLDLKNVIIPYVTIDEFEPKSGTNEEILILSFYCKNKNAAEDLRDFIEKGYNSFIDVDLSDNPNTDGNYLVFVELDRTPSARTNITEIIQDVENTTGKMTWQISTYLDPLSKKYPLKSNEWVKYVSWSKDEYMTKKEYNRYLVRKSFLEDFTKYLDKNVKILRDGVEINNNYFKIVSVSDDKIFNRIDEGIYQQLYDTELTTVKNSFGISYNYHTSKNYIFVENKENNQVIMISRKI